MADKKRPSRIEVHPAVMAGIEKHAYSNLEAEVGGVFYGSISGKTTKITGSVPASKASAEQMTLTFTHEVWEDIYRQGEKYFPGEQIVGWYHTHPSFGLFLSEYDQFIQKNFFANVGQLALVIDPIAGNMGWFELKKAETEMFFEEPTKTGPKPRDEASPKSTGKPPLLLAGISAAVSAALTWGVTASFTPADLSGAFAAQQNDLFSLQQQLYAAESELGYTERGFSFLYTVRKGDTKASIAQLFFGTADAVKTLIEDNPDLKSSEPEVDTQVLIVGAVGIERVATQPKPETPVSEGSTDSTESKDAKDSKDTKDNK